MNSSLQATNDDAAYQEIFTLLSKNTEEYDNFIALIEREIIPHLPSSQHFVDVGAGRGNITKSIAKHFANGSIVEPNVPFFNEIMDWAKTDYPQLLGYNTIWDNVELSAPADFMVLSHVLYYVVPEQHRAFIEKAYKSLRSQAAMVIALYGQESDTWKLSQLLDNPEIFTRLPYAEKLHQQLSEWGYTASFHPFESHIITQNAEQMRRMIDFLLLGRIIFDEAKSAIRESYMQKHLARKNDYSIRSGGGIIIIRKS